MNSIPINYHDSTKLHCNQKWETGETIHIFNRGNIDELFLQTIKIQQSYKSVKNELHDFLVSNNVKLET